MKFLRFVLHPAIVGVICGHLLGIIEAGCVWLMMLSYYLYITSPRNFPAFPEEEIEKD